MTTAHQFHCYHPSLSKITLRAKLVSLLHSCPLQPIVYPAVRAILSKPKADHIIHLLKNLKPLPISTQNKSPSCYNGHQDHINWLLVISPISSPILSCFLVYSSHTGLLAVYQIHSACFHSTAFTMAVFSVWNIFPPYLHGSSFPNLLQVSAQIRTSLPRPSY